MTSRTRLWPWIVATVIVMPVLYVASFGPACWIGTRIDASSFREWQDEPVQATIVYTYRPMILTALRSKPIAAILEWYAGACAAVDEGPLFEPAAGRFIGRGPGYSTHVIDHWH